MSDTGIEWLAVQAQLEYLNKLTPGKTWTKFQLDKHASKGTGFKHKFLLGKRVTTKAWIDEWLCSLIRDS